MSIEIRFGDEDSPVHEESIKVLDQDFEIPPDALPVRIQVGSMPLTVVGWITGADALPALLRDVARANEEALEEWDAATPEASRTGSNGEEAGIDG